MRRSRGSALLRALPLAALAALLGTACAPASPPPTPAATAVEVALASTPSPLPTVVLLAPGSQASARRHSPTPWKPPTLAPTATATPPRSAAGLPNPAARARLATRAAQGRAVPLPPPARWTPSRPISAGTVGPLIAVAGLAATETPATSPVPLPPTGHNGETRTAAARAVWPLSAPPPTDTRAPAAPPPGPTATAPATRPRIEVQPGTLDYQATHGGAEPRSQVVVVRNAGPRPVQIQWRYLADDTRGWLPTSNGYPPPAPLPPGGEIRILLVPNSSRLPPGVYHGHLNLVASDAEGEQHADVPITLTVLPAERFASPDLLALRARPHAAVSGRLTLANSSSGSVRWEVVATDESAADWLVLSPDRGTLAPGEVLPIAVDAEAPATSTNGESRTYEAELRVTIQPEDGSAPREERVKVALVVEP